VDARCVCEGISNMKPMHIALPAALVALCLFGGCLPTVEPTKHPTEDGALAALPPPPSTEVPESPQAVAKNPNQLPPAKIETLPAPDGGASSTLLKMKMQEEAGSAPGNATIRVERSPDGHFIVNGGEGLNGTITKNPSGTWVFDGTIKFPLKGYTVETPFATSLDNMILAPGGAALKKEGAQTMLTIPFKYPARGAAADRIEESFPLHLEFDAPPNTEFAVFLLPGT